MMTVMRKIKKDYRNYLNHPISGWGMVAQVTQHTVQAASVQLGLVHKEQDQKAGHGLMVEQLPSFRLGGPEQRGGRERLSTE